MHTVGKKHVTFRENNNKLLVTVPYCSIHLGHYLTDDIARITATGGFTKLTPWK